MGLLQPVKDLRSGEQTAVAQDNVAAHFLLSWEGQREIYENEYDGGCGRLLCRKRQALAVR